MNTTRKLMLLPGDGIGPEILQEVRRVAQWLNEHRGAGFEISKGLIGGAALDAQGTPLADDTVAAMLQADAIVFGAVGGPRWDDLPSDQRPEGVNGLLRMRSALGLHTKLCPIRVHDALLERSPLKPERAAGLDFVIVREIAAGIYFGTPRGIEPAADGGQRGFNTESYTTAQVAAVARSAFTLARTRKGQVCSVDKANILESSRVWRQEVQRVRDAEFPDVALTHMYIDNAAMQLLRAPAAFDVLLTTNMFGDILSDAAAGIVGSLGMMPTAEFGRTADGRTRAVYQAVHGSAPDIAGQGIANPIGTLLSFSLALRHSFDLAAEADLLDYAVQAVLEGGGRTADIESRGTRRLTTAAMGQAIVAAMSDLRSR